MRTEAVSVMLLAQPLDLSMTTRGDFRVGIEATNRGAAPIDPGLDRARLLINGEDSLAWSDAILNGHQARARRYPVSSRGRARPSLERRTPCRCTK